LPEFDWVGGHEITPPQFFESIFRRHPLFFAFFTIRHSSFFFAILEGKNGFSSGKNWTTPPEKMTSPGQEAKMGRKGRIERKEICAP
jgi:hypothetical protein